MRIIGRKLESHAGQFITQRLVYKRFSSAEQYGCSTGGATHVIASLLAGAETAADRGVSQELTFKEEMSNLVALHIEKIENDYAQIGIWGGVLSVIFIIFGFFAIFKIEETKADAKDVLSNVKKQGLNASIEITKLQDQATNLNSFLATIKQNSDSFISNKTEEFDTLIQDIVKMHDESTKNIERISNLLKEVETKNTQYQWSVETMSTQMKQLEALTEMLNNILTEKGREASHE